MNYECILLAAGEGQRACLGYNKVLYKVNGIKEIVLYSLEYFLSDPQCKKIILVINERDRAHFKNLVKNPNVVFAIGGSTRGESVHSGLSKVDSEYVIVHDAARPLVYKEDVFNLLQAMNDNDGAALATKVYNTTCLIDNGFVKEYFSRHTLASLITPQCFKTEKLINAYQEAAKAGTEFTDDSGIFKAYSGNVKLVFTDNISIKVTTSYDIKLLEVLFDAHRQFN